MAGYTGMILTKAGLQLQAQAQIGGELRITKIAVGDGMLANGENYEDLTTLKNQKITLGIQDMEITGDGQSRIRALLTNDNLNAGFFVREVGVFAKVGENGTETLYSYTNASDKADYLPNKGINIVEEVLEVYIIVGNAQNVTCTINDRVTLATKQDLAEHTSNTNNPHNTVASQVANTFITGLGTEDVQSTLEAIFSESKKKSGSVRNVVVTGPVSTSGMANVLRDRYTDNLCVGGTPISGGGTTAGALDNVFDGNRVTTGWESQQKRNACNGLAWVGYTFSVAKTIKKIMLYQNDSGGGVTSVKVQYGADGVTWNDALTTTTTLATSDLRIPGTYSAKCWRVLANSNGIDNSSVNGWGVREIEMYELLNPELTDSDVLIQADALVSFAAGFDLINKQPLDYWELTQQMLLTLEAVDGYTVPLSYTDDLCNGGMAVSSGDKTGLDSNGAKELAFNNNDNNQSGWRSLQVYNAISGVAYIGYKLATARHIRKARLVQPTATENVSSVKLQFSDEGITWTTVGTYAVTGGENYLVFPDVRAHQYWRFLANSNASTVNWYWVVSEVEMYEALQTHYVYLTRDVNGNVSVGSTRNKPRTVKSTDTLADIYSDNLCVGGAALSGGDTSGYAKEQAFDNNSATWWASSQLASAGIGIANVGYDFGVARHIRKLIITVGSVGGAPSSIKVQRSSDVPTWTDVKTVDLHIGDNVIYLPASTASRFWRVLANGARIDGATGAGIYFTIPEISMHEASSDINLYDPIVGVSRYYDGSTWDNVVRVFVGEAIVDSAGSIVSYITYPYNKVKLKALPAEDADDVVTLGQLIDRESTSGVGWVKFSDGTLIQRGGGTTNASGVLAVAFPVSFINNSIALVASESNTTLWDSTLSLSVYGKQDLTATGVTVKGMKVSNGGAVSLATASAFNWVAIGRWKE